MNHHPARCLKCGRPTMRRLDRDVGICLECELPVDSGKRKVALTFRPDCGQFA